MTLALRHSEEQKKIDHLQKQEKISLLRATEEVKQTLQETELEWEKKQSSMTTRLDDLGQKVQEEKLDSQALSMPDPSSEWKTSSTISPPTLCGRRIFPRFRLIYIMCFFGKFFLGFLEKMGWVENLCLKVVCETG